MQRLMDFLLSSVALLLLLPLLLPLSILLLMTGEGEVFFMQNRVGKDGKTIKLYKFATMLKNSPNIGTGTVTTDHDPRVLPLGRFLRKYKINELPQLLNVLNGDMSIIGPRPQTRRCFDAFPSAAQKAIIQVRPGLSGVGSIVFRAEETLFHGQADVQRYYDEVIAPYKGELEEWYVANRGLRTYLMCIGLTVWVVPFSNSNLVWRVFNSLPRPQNELSVLLQLPGAE